MAREMSLLEAAKKWGMSANWVRQLVKTGRVKARLNTDVPVAYYAIPIDEPKPGSMRMAPFRKGSPVVLKPESLERREQRAKKGKPTKAKRKVVKPPKAKQAKKSAVPPAK